MRLKMSKSDLNIKNMFLYSTKKKIKLIIDIYFVKGLLIKTK